MLEEIAEDHANSRKLFRSMSETKEGDFIQVGFTLDVTSPFDTNTAEIFYRGKQNPKKEGALGIIYLLSLETYKWSVHVGANFSIYKFPPILTEEQRLSIIPYLADEPGDISQVVKTSVGQYDIEFKSGMKSIPNLKVTP